MWWRHSTAQRVAYDYRSTASARHIIDFYIHSLVITFKVVFNLDPKEKPFCGAMWVGFHGFTST